MCANGKKVNNYVLHSTQFFNSTGRTTCKLYSHLKEMTKRIRHHFHRREHFQLPTDEYGEENEVGDEMNAYGNYHPQQMQMEGNELITSLMDEATNGNNDNNIDFVYRPFPEHHHHHHLQHQQQQYNSIEYMLPKNSEEEMLNNNNNDSVALLDVSALLQQVSTALIPSTTTSSPLLLSSLPPSSTLSTITVSKDNIKTIKLVAYCYVLPVVCVLGIIGNLMNVVTLASPRLRAVSYMYLRALAIADLLCMCFVLVFATFEVLREVVGVPIDRQPMFGFYQAHVMLSFINWTLSTGVLIVVALSLERFVSVVFPLHFRTWNSPQRALKAIIVAYVVPAVFYIPYGIGRYSVKKGETPNGDVFYYPDDSAVSKTMGWQVYKWTREGLLRFLPIVILFVLNSQIMVAFRRRQKMFNRLRNRDQTTIARDDTLLYILGGIAVMFFVCNIPAAINLLFINEMVKKRLDYQVFRAMANLLEITNHAAQFYIFCVCSSDYRITFMQKFPCLRAYYITPKFYSFIRNGPKRSAVEQGESSAGGRSAVSGTKPMLRRVKSERTRTTKYDEEGTGGGRSTEGMLCMRSTTVTAELASNCEAKVTEQDTVDSRVQLASEESLSDESETLLSNNINNNSNYTKESKNRCMDEMGWRRNSNGRIMMANGGETATTAATEPRHGDNNNSNSSGATSTTTTTTTAAWARTDSGGGTTYFL